MPPILVVSVMPAGAVAAVVSVVAGAGIAAGAGAVAVVSVVTEVLSALPLSPFLQAARAATAASAKMESFFMVRFPCRQGVEMAPRAQRTGGRMPAGGLLPGGVGL